MSVIEEESQAGKRISLRSIGALGIFAFLASGCSNPTPQASDETTSAGIDVDGAETQSEQIDEIEFVVDKLSEHFGDEVAEWDGEPWTVERFEEEVGPEECGDDAYRYRVALLADHLDEEEILERSEEFAEDLGLTPAEGNSEDAEGPNVIWSAGQEEGRQFVATATGAEEGMRILYHTQCSDHPTVQEDFEERREQQREERREEFPPVGEGEDDS